MRDEKGTKVTGGRHYRMRMRPFCNNKLGFVTVNVGKMQKREQMVPQRRQGPSGRRYA